MLCPIEIHVLRPEDYAVSGFVDAADERSTPPPSQPDVELIKVCTMATVLTVDCIRS